MNTIYTYGYGGSRTAQADLKAYVLAGAVILDIRYSRRSSVPGMNEYQLSAVLNYGYDDGSFPTNYAVCGTLGNINYRSGGPIRLASPMQGLDELGSRLHLKSVVLLCGCANVEVCHRKDVAEMAQSRWPSVLVRHLKPGDRIG